MSEPIDPAAVMAEHTRGPEHYLWTCVACLRIEYDRLAEALAAEQAKTARVAELAHRFEIVPRARLLGALTAKAKP